MNYESQGVQSKWREIEITQEARSGQNQRSQSKGSQTSKTSTKGWIGRPCTCQNCGIEFFTKRSIKETPKSCSWECRQKHKPKWQECAKCHTLLGIGAINSSKILGCVTYTSIWEYLNKQGIKMDNKHQRWRLWRQRKEIYNRNWWENKQLLTAWNKEQSPKFPDWSYLWIKEKARIKMMNKYKYMTVAERRFKWREDRNNRDMTKAREYINKWRINKSKSDPAWRLAQTMRSRLSGIIKGANMGGMQGFIGCNIDQLRRHIESSFTKRMTWDNYGTYWHVDHILPVSSFDHSDKKQVKQCWHWSNLEPLEVKANLAKSNNITKPQMNLLLECYV